MKRFLFYIPVFLIAFACCINLAYSQTLQSKINNYTSFSVNNTNTASAASKSNLAQGNTVNQEPKTIDELNADATEVIEKRTINSKYYIDKRNPAKFYELFSYGGNLHYLKNGKLQTIDSRLAPASKGLFLASQQEEPVGFDANKKMAFIETVAGKVNFNNWTLIGQKTGVQSVLAHADWSDYTAGDDGMLVHNLFPGIDAEMTVRRGAIKTNFIIRNNQFPLMDKLILQDQFSTAKEGGQLVYDISGEGHQKAVFMLNNKSCLTIGRVVVSTEKDAAHNFFYADYTINNNRLSFSLDASYINTHLASGNIIIDPLVSASNTLAESSITGSMNCGSYTNYCSYPLNVPTPPKATFTDVAFQFGFYANSPSGENQGHFSMTSGTCSSGEYSVVDPTVNTGPGTVSTFGSFADINSILPCLPPPACTSQNVPFELHFFNDYCLGATGCSDTYVTAEEPLIIRIEGYTVQLNTITSPVIICNGSSAVLSVTGEYGVPPYTYKWSNNATTPNITVSPSATTNYSVVITDACGNTATGSTAVSVNPIPSVKSVTSNSPICAGSTLNLSTPAVSGATYSWIGPGGFISNINNPTIANTTPAQSGNYQVMITVNGCTSPVATTSVSISTPVTPAVSITSSATTICAGTAITFTATPVNGGTTPAYQWLLNGKNTGTNSATYTSSTIANNDVVSCVLTSSVGCYTSPTATSNAISIKVNPITVPTISIVASTATTICAGTSVSFTATATNGGAAPAYQWLLNGANVGTDAATYTNSSLNTGDIISCVLTSNAICSSTPTAISNTIKFNVVPLVTPAVSISASANSICPGTSVTFTATPTNGGSAPVYQWAVNGTNAGSNSNTYTSAILNNNDVITCVLTSNVSCVTANTATSNGITMAVSTPVTPAVSIAASASTICVGTLVTFTATPVNGGTSPGYQWLLNGANTGTNAATYSNSTLADKDVVTCVLTSSIGCTTAPTGTSNAITLRVNPITVPSISITASTPATVCAGTSVNFTAVAVNGGATPSYQWLLNGANVGTNAGSYTNTTLNTADVVSCVLTSDAICTSTPTATSNTIKFTIIPLVMPMVSIVASANAICPGTPVTFTATPGNGGSAPVYQWEVNGNNVGTNNSTYSSSSLNNNDLVTCVLTSNVTCVTANTATSNTITMAVSTPVTPAVSITASATTICAGTSVDFTATPVNGGTTPGYQWALNGSNVGINAATYSNSTLNNGDVITCLLTSSIGCITNQSATSGSIVMVVNPVLTPAVSITASSSIICAGSPVTFTASAVNCGSGPQYDWQINGTDAGATDAVYTSALLQNNDVVSCMVTPQAGGCYSATTTTSNTIPITVNAVPTVSAGNDTVVFKGASFLLRGSATGDIATYLWVPSTYLSSTSVPNPVITPLATTTYTLHAISVANCEATANVTIKVLTKIIVPNAFTPNGDGINDTWRIAGLADYTGATIDVYNRYGQSVFHATTYKEWDGNYNGKPLPSSTYYYIINPKNNLPLLSGWVVIIR